MSEVGRNDPCPCGSGKKYKSCCLSKKQAKPMGLSGRKFTAKVLSGPKVQEEQASPGRSPIMPVDYNALMERSFGEALKKFPEKPPIPENPDQYLAENEEKKEEELKK